MTRCKVAAADPNTGELLVRGFIKLDSSRKPNMYVSAMRAIQTARSPRLRQVGWEDIQRMHPPPMTLKKDTPEETRLKLRCERDEAYEELRARIERFPNGSGTVREPISEGELEVRMKVPPHPPTKHPSRGSSSGLLCVATAVGTRPCRTASAEPALAVGRSDE